MLSDLDISAITVTIKLAFISTAILIVIGTPLAWWLSQTKFKFKVIFEAIIALPLILPPTVLGFYLLITLGSNSPLGALLESYGGSSIAFSFSGLVIGSVIYSLPFVVQPLQNSFSAVKRQSLEVASTLGASQLRSLFYSCCSISSLWFCDSCSSWICTHSRRIWSCANDWRKYSG